jgi:hypothetical protein
MSRKWIVALSAVAVVAVGTSLVLAAPNRPRVHEENRALKAAEGAQLPHAQSATGLVAPLAQPRHVQRPRRPDALGTIIYDTGVAGFVATVSSSTVGNQFDTAFLGPVMTSGSVTMCSFYLLGLSGGAAFVTVYGPVMGTTASPLSSMSFGGLALGFNTVTFAGGVPYTGSSFLAGVWNLNVANPANNDAIALDGNSVGGQGFHAMVINDLSGTGFTTIPTLNAIFGASGDVLTPVELMNFTVSD